jgi:hypothetical protein
MKGNLAKYGGLLVLLAWQLSASRVEAGGPARFMMRSEVDGQTLEGRPLWWSDRQMFLLGRDGALHEFAPQDAENSQKTAPRFIPYTPSELSSQLRGEFGRAYDVTTTNHFVVVHPHGQWQAWADRLELLYRTFVHCMSVRGFSIEDPPAPLVAVVFRSQQDYYRYASASGTPLAPGTLGHYDPLSNRIFLYDQAGAVQNGDHSAAWAQNAETIIHEAVHQTAYNVGVHNRFATQPRWLSEGLAMLFEAPGIWNPSVSRRAADRLNQQRLIDFRRGNKRRSPDWIGRLVSSDRGFETDAITSYAEAWVLTYYLFETQPRAYCDLLARAAARPGFSDYAPPTRVSDFARILGSDWKMLAAQVDRYVQGL